MISESLSNWAKVTQHLRLQSLIDLSLLLSSQEKEAGPLKAQAERGPRSGAVPGVSQLVQLPLAFWYPTRRGLARLCSGLQNTCPVFLGDFPELHPPASGSTGHCSSGLWLRIFTERQKAAGYVLRVQGMGSRRFSLLWLRPNCNSAVSRGLPALQGFGEISFEPPIHGMSPMPPQNFRL